MEIKRCPNGHFYDAEKCTTCPTCANENGSQAFTFGGNVGTSSVTRATEPAESYGKTVPIDYSVDNSITFTPPQNVMPTSAFGGGPIIPQTVPVEEKNGEKGNGGGVEPYQPTRPIGVDDQGRKGRNLGVEPSSLPFERNTPAGFNPVTGWLVCVEGPSKGTDYRIHGQYNYIGRAQHMDICISGDEYISAEKAAILAYDDMEKKFFIAPGMGHNLVRLNGKMVMGSEMLNPYDKITIGKSKLIFVPLCGEQFDWKEN